jgi:hypothetical protein
VDDANLKIISALEARLQAIDEEHRSKRAPVAAALAALKQGSIPNPVTPPPPGPSPRRGTSRPKQAAYEPPQDGQLKRGVAAKLLREAVDAQTQPFTVVDIRAYLDTRYPAHSPQISAGRISNELDRLRKIDILETVGKRAKGAKNTYRRMTK